MSKGELSTGKYHGRLLSLVKQGQFRKKSKKDLLKNLDWQIRAHTQYADKCLAEQNPDLGRTVFLLESLLQIRKIVEAA